MSVASHPASAAGRALEAHLLGQLDFDRCLALQQRLVYEAGGRRDQTITLLVCEHPPIITIGRGGSRGQLRAAAQDLASRQIEVRWVNRGGGALVHAPGQVAVYPIVPLDRLGWTVGDYLRRLQAGLAAMLQDVGLSTSVRSDLDGIWGRTGQLVAISAAVKNWVTYHGAFVNVAPAMALQRLVDGDLARGLPLSSLVIERQQAVKMTSVRAALVARLSEALCRIATPPAQRPSLARRNFETSPMSDSAGLFELPIVSPAELAGQQPDAQPPDALPPDARLPRWLKRNIPLGGGNRFTARLIEELRLETVCESAKCPNRMECWSQQTATFMILGNVCTRPCGFCSVPKGKTEALAADEPDRVAEAALRLGLASTS